MSILQPSSVSRFRPATWEVGLVASIVLPLLSSVARASTVAPAAADPAEGFALGYHLSSVANNFGAGLDIEPPHFLNGHLGVLLSGDYAWVQGIRKGDTTESWTPYGHVRLELCGGSYANNDVLRIEGCGGASLLLPSRALSSESTHWGGFGLVKLDVFIGGDKTQAFFVDFGAVGTSARADKLSGKPIFASGFLTNWGFRFFL